jgi:hypothetical protein
MSPEKFHCATSYSSFRTDSLHEPKVNYNTDGACYQVERFMLRALEFASIANLADFTHKFSVIGAGE